MEPNKNGGQITSRVKIQPQTVMFKVRSYGGKCLDYGPPWQGKGATVFLNSCAAAHAIQVQEVNENHEVVLHAGNQVIGVHNPPVNAIGARSRGPQAEYALELQQYNPALASTANQMFRLDGDSIIWESALPCLNNGSRLCPPPPPQLVVQIQNARGADGSLLVASLRNLADSEFWDFQSLNGAAIDPTKSFVRVSTNYELWNALCKNPTVRRSLGVPVIDDPGQPDDGQLAFNGLFGKGLHRGCEKPKAGWGTVIVLSDDPDECQLPEMTTGPPPNVGPCIDLTLYPPLPLPAGVTLRGDRRGINFGPQLYFFSSPSSARFTPSECDLDQCMLVIQGDYARVSGLRLRGQSRSTDAGPRTAAIIVGYPPGSAPLTSQNPDPGSPLPPLFSITNLTEYIATIDHNDMSDWGDSAVFVSSPYNLSATSNSCSIAVLGTSISYPCDGMVPDPRTQKEMDIVNDPATLGNAQVTRNFIHHNETNGGYGIDVGRALIVGNTFLMDRHDITATGEPHNEYEARFNLVLGNAPQYTGTCVAGVCTHYFNQDFDMHGTADPNHWVGGLGGYYVNIFGNTFLGSFRPNFELRGIPRKNSLFEGNIALQSEGDAIDFNVCPPDFPYICSSTPPEPINVVDNQFGVANPVTRLGAPSLGVGDFDGDGLDDLFLATGAAWYYSPGGAREWRFLRADTTPIGQLLFGDFDGDGRTDVVTMQNGRLMVSWGGISAWEVLNPNPGIALPANAITQMAVGDFDGDGQADLFFADGKTWQVSFSGNTPFIMVQTSSFQVKDLRFGDFNGDGRTDVFGVEGGNWSVSFSNSKFRGLFSPWQKLRTKLTNNVDGLFVADFRGAGLVDIATDCGANAPGCWRISRDGKQDWRTIQLGTTGPYVAGIGHFLGHRNAGHSITDLLSWQGFELSISAGGTAALTPYSTQDMR